MGLSRPYFANPPLGGEPAAPGGALAFAHRGGAALSPENTLAAFQRAVDLGIRWIETDVHLSRDGHVMVFHDDLVDRTTDGHGPVRSFTRAELERLDAGYRFSPDGQGFPQRARDHRVPTFDEVLRRFPEVRFNVELKHGGPELIEAFWQLLVRHEAFDRVLVAAAKDRVRLEWQARARGVVATSPGARGVLEFWSGARLGVPLPARPDWDVLQVPVKHGPLTVVDERFVQAAHARGLGVHVWTIDDPAEMRRLLALGVDGIMSDRPDVLIGVMREAPSAPAA